LSEDQQSAAVEAIRDRAAEGAEEQPRDAIEETDDAQE